MTTNAPDLPPNWGPAPNGRSAHQLLAPLYDYADVTDERLDDLESRSGTSVTRLRESVATSTALPATGNTTGDTRITEDTGRFWVWDGTGWVDTGTVAQVPGVTDHGALAGLEQDDHPQYLTQVRGDARYVQPSGLPTTPTWDTLAGRPAVIAAGTSQTVARNAIGAGTSNLQLGTGPTTAAAGDHGHTLNETTDTATRVAMTPAERTKLGGVAANATANATDAQLRARSGHTGTQAISTVDGLQTALNSKAGTTHGHSAADLTSGTVPVARLGASGTRDGGTVLHGDNTWRPAPSGGGGELVVNVLDHGAVPDFTGSPFTGSGTNNLAAFNAAMAACPKGGTILVPPGRYYLSNTWQITKTVRIDCGPGGIEPQADTGTELIFSAGVTGIRVGVTGSVRPDGAVLGPLKLTSKSQGTGAGVGVLIKNAQRVMVPAGIGAYYFGSHGFFVDGSVEGDLTNIGTFTRVHAYGNGGDGIRCEGDDAQANIFIKPDVVANKGWGINVEGSAHNVFDAPHADQQYGGSPGAFRDNGNATDWRHIYSEGAAPMLLDTGSLFAKVTMSNYAKPVFTDATAGKTALVTDEWGTQGAIKVVGQTTGARYQLEVDGWNGTWATFQKRDATGGFEKLIWSTTADGTFTFGGQVVAVPGWFKIGGLFLRDNAGALEKSTDGSTWTAV